MGTPAAGRGGGDGGAEAKERENEGPQTTGPSAPAPGHLKCQITMPGYQIPVWSAIAFCVEMPFLSIDYKLLGGASMTCNSLVFNSREWQVGPNSTLCPVPGCRLRGNPHQQESSISPCLPACVNQGWGGGAGLGMAWGPTLPPAWAWLPVAFPGRPKREGRAGGELAGRCNLSWEEFPALPQCFY